jgi:hypothetical protein
MEEKATLEAMV